MCGIFGILQNQPVLPAILSEISSVISHRGPDDEGYLLIDTTGKNVLEAIGKDSQPGKDYPDIRTVRENYNCAFVHRRLSIIDLSSGAHQPLSDAGKTLWIIFNGEIYNYIEVQNELKSKGYTFQTSSDTEVILAAYREWGEECVLKFNGIWAFAIYDSKADHFFISRDRVGVKPLYYYHEKGRFIFSSEIKAIRHYLHNKTEINYNKIDEYLSYGQIFIGKDETTFFKGINQLMPGCNLNVKNDKVAVRKYWDLSLTRIDMGMSETVEKFRRHFQESLRLQFRSDVEVGSCLSGGIDSSSIVSFSSASFGTNLHTFSAIWPGEKIDESRFINAVNEKYHCKPHMFEPSMSDITGLIDKELWHLEIPITGASLLAQLAVFESVKKSGVKVVLDGEGSDEILAGYPKYIITYLIELITRMKLNELIKQYGDLKKAGYKIKSIAGIQRRRWTIDKSSREFSDFPFMYNTLADFLMNDIIKYSLPTLLHHKDRNSMAHSVEARVPFLDHNLIEFALSIPAEYKIKGANTKYILKEAMKPFLPEEIFRRRDKIGFATPIETRLFHSEGEHKSLIKESVKSSGLREIIEKRESDISTTFGYRKDFCMYSLARFIQIWS